MPVLPKLAAATLEGRWSPGARTDRTCLMGVSLMHAPKKEYRGVRATRTCLALAAYLCLPAVALAATSSVDSDVLVARVNCA